MCVGIEALRAVVMKGTTIWSITSLSLLKVNRRFGGTYRLNPSSLRPLAISFKALGSFDPKDEENISSETSFDFQRATRRYIGKDF
jgi:hypothetical protein